jgi:membrane protein involved in colicin uptake
MIEQLSVRDAVAAAEARALLESWRHGSSDEGVSAAPAHRRADMGDDPEHLVVIVKSPSEVARAEKKAREKAKKKAKKKAKREREQARAKATALAEAERERLRLSETAPEAAVADSVLTSTTDHLLGVEPTQRLSLLRPEDDQPR